MVVVVVVRRLRVLAGKPLCRLLWSFEERRGKFGSFMELVLGKRRETSLSLVLSCWRVIDREEPPIKLRLSRAPYRARMQRIWNKR